ncbi:MAG TPA: DinB family protein, partial [Vicinamibacteria bacterium]|nr:DinB family protein [Vicinamibacteria bacterium]
WKKAVSGLEAAQRGLRTAASKLSDERLQETVPGQESTYWYLLHGIMNHDLYHTGQISLLKKGL